MKSKKVCCICKDEFEGFAYNPNPYETGNSEKVCCEICYDYLVYPLKNYIRQYKKWVELKPNAELQKN